MAGAVLACLYYLAGELFLLGGRLGFPLDDSWIHLQFASRLAAGDGLSFNPGVPMPGSTAPLWTCLLALGFVLPGGPLLWTKLFGVLFYVLGAHAAERLAAELGLGRGLRWLAAAATAATHWLVWSALSAMEVPLFTFLALWGLILHIRERRSGGPPRSLAVLAAACLSRPEGYLLLVLAGLDRLVAARFGGLRSSGGWRATAELVGLCVLVLLPTLVFYNAVGGSPLPTTFAVKTTPLDDLLPSLRYLRVVLGLLFEAQPVLLLAAGAGALRLAERLGTERDAGLLPALWLLGQPLAYAVLAAEEGAPVVGNFGRYFFPLFPVVVVLGLLGLETAAGRLRESLPERLRRPVLAGLAALVLVPQLWGIAVGSARYSQTVANVEESDVRAARWMAGWLPPEALLAVQDIGAIKFFLPNRVLDLVGIVNPEISPHLWGTGPDDPTYWEDRLLAFLAERRPDYLVVFPSSYPKLTGGTAGFELVQSFPIRRNVTMAGDELAVFSTPWNRFPPPAVP